MPENRKAGDEVANQEAAPSAAESTAQSGDAVGTGGDAQLDLDGLDLTVESVEERISPSETNVFDK